MSVLDRDALAESPLADLHLLAAELGVDSYRRLRKADLVDAIIAKQGGGGEDAPGASEEAGAADEAPKRPRRRRGGRGRKPSDAPEGDDDAVAEEPELPTTTSEPEAEAPAPESAEESSVEGVLEVLSNGSGFVRVSGPEPSEQDAYVSAAQVRRCELVSGDRVSGPVRKPRRSERYPSLVRVETINGRPADEVAEGTRWEDLPAAFPDDRFKLGAEDPTIKAIEWLTPFGRGSRVVIAGGPRAGKSEALRRLAHALSALEGVELFAALAGVRPEEIAEWSEGPVAPAASASFAAAPDSLAAAVERVVDQARRIAARGGDAVVLVDTLDGLPPAAARKALAAARNISGGGSLTLIATASAPLGGETTVIALDAHLTSTGRFPALDLLGSGTLRPEFLVGDAGAQAIQAARTEAASG